MKINMKNFIKALLKSSEFVEKGVYGFPIEHGLRVSFGSLKLAKELNLSSESMFDIIILALFHDSGILIKEMFDIVKRNKFNISKVLISSREHCILGEENIKYIPFLTSPKNVLLYHHENIDGSGPFGITGDDIPLMSQIIFLMGSLDHVFNFELASKNNNLKDKMLEYCTGNIGKMYSQKVVEAFLRMQSDYLYWNTISNGAIFEEIDKELKDYTIDTDYSRVLCMTSVFSKIIDLKSPFTSDHSSGLAKKMKRMIKYYKLSEIHGHKLVIAADLHDLGKIGISNDILDKEGKLTSSEFKEIKKHPTIAWECLKYIDGLEDINEWILNHHEKLDGSGYPRGLKDTEIDFNSRLLSCLDIFQALGEKRPYRNRYSKKKSFEIMSDMVNNNLIDKNICEDIFTVFKDD